MKTRLFNYWDSKKEEGVPHYLYTLIDPRNGEICYIGITKQKFKDRLNQHKNPIPSNMTAIAKLQRHLKSIGLSIKGEARVKGSEEFISGLEKHLIAMFWAKYGKTSLKNHREGGRDAYNNIGESIKKANATKRKNIESGKFVPLKGDKNPSSKVTEEQILEIYKLIRELYTNSEIIKHLNLNLGVTGLNQIRMGVNWKEVFEREGMEKIQSMYITEGALGSQDKIKVMIEIESGICLENIQEKYGLSLSDLRRIENKTLWKLAWKAYEKYYKN